MSKKSSPMELLATHFGAHSELEHMHVTTNLNHKIIQIQYASGLGYQKDTVASLPWS